MAEGRWQGTGDEIAYIVIASQFIMKAACGFACIRHCWTSQQWHTTKNKRPSICKLKRPGRGNDIGEKAVLGYK